MKTVKTVNANPASALSMAVQASAAAHPELYDSDTRDYARRYGEQIKAASKAYDVETKTIADVAAETDAKVNSIVVECRAVMLTKGTTAEALKGNARTNAFLRFIPQMLRAIYTDQQDKSIAQYATSFKIAFEQGVPFERGLFRNGAKAAKKASPKAPKSITMEKFCKQIQALVESCELLESNADVKAFKSKLVKAADAHLIWRAEDSAE